MMKISTGLKKKKKGFSIGTASVGWLLLKRERERGRE
jgi:hypothetical protein